MKRPLSDVIFTPGFVTPRSIERGPVEAGSLAGDLVAQRTTPRSIERGPVEARSHQLAR